MTASTPSPALILVPRIQTGQESAPLAWNQSGIGSDPAGQTF
jgi:hypothetical protein